MRVGIIGTGAISHKHARAYANIGYEVVACTDFHADSARAFADRYGPYGRIVILDHGDHYYSVSGDLDEVPTPSLMRMLGHRYPALPVVALDAPQAALAHA